ncbi:hypothetical protein QAD02_004952 [Eretmocerus hayati]|uniref:Uncharacterized protein n=1 Tax=Eretmocerus hayati TaxID=131215 RepID=A0ACC2NQZ6_9HYME|nr:hypothetical protein QAD02_004952 [Eretmocerus hayati]
MSSVTPVTQIESADNEFLQAVKRRDRPAIEDALKNGANVTATDSHGRTCLHYAILEVERRRLNITVVNLYEEEFVVPEDDLPSTTYAIEQFNLQKTLDGIEEIPEMDLSLVRLLIDSGAFVDALDEKGNSCLHYAVENKDCLGLIQLLLDAGVEIDRVDKGGHSPLMIALSIDNLTAVKILMSRGADIRIISSSLGETSLHLAKSDEAFRILLDAGTADMLNLPTGLARKSVDPTYTSVFDIIGKTPFQAALEYCKIDTLERMIKSGADVRYTGGEDGTLCPQSPLLAAIYTRRKEVVEILLMHGADPNYANHNSDDDSSCGIYASSDFVFAISYLGQGYSDGTNTSQKALEDIIKLLISYGADYASSSGFNQLLTYGTLDLIRWFLELFKQKGLKKCPGTYDPPLHLALKNPNLDVFPFVLESRIGDLKAVDEDNYTLVNLAIQYHWEDKLIMLLDLGANINYVMWDVYAEKKSVIQAAFESKSLSCIELLLCYGSLPASLIDLTHVDLESDLCRLSDEARREIGKKILMHVSLVEKLGLFVDASFFEWMEKFFNLEIYSREFHTTCKTELELMEATQIRESVTVYDILSGKEFDQYAKSLSLITDAREQNSSTKFPIYNYWIQFRTVQLETRHEMMSNAVNGLKRILGLEPDTFDHIYQDILRQLTRVDWYVLQKV